MLLAKSGGRNVRRLKPGGFKSRGQTAVPADPLGNYSRGHLRPLFQQFTDLRSPASSRSPAPASVRPGEAGGSPPSPYKLLRQALDRSSRVAIAKYAWSGRERLGLLRLRDDAIVLHAMRWP
jgi:hypothetical protein